jgi:hypothetical protein
MAPWTTFTRFRGNNKEDWLARRQGFKGKGSGAKEDPSPASNLIIIEPDFNCQLNIKARSSLDFYCL